MRLKVLPVLLHDVGKSTDLGVLDQIVAALGVPLCGFFIIPPRLRVLASPLRHASQPPVCADLLKQNLDYKPSDGILEGTDSGIHGRHAASGIYEIRIQ